MFDFGSQMQNEHQRGGGHQGGRAPADDEHARPVGHVPAARAPAQEQAVVVPVPALRRPHRAGHHVQRHALRGARLRRRAAADDAAQDRRRLGVLQVHRPPFLHADQRPHWTPRPGRRRGALSPHREQLGGRPILEHKIYQNIWLLLGKDENPAVYWSLSKQN
jgi:hypothetical protein